MVALGDVRTKGGGGMEVMRRNWERKSMNGGITGAVK